MPVDLVSSAEKASPSGYLLKPRNICLNEQRPSPNPFIRKLIVLTDRGTFSTASDISALLRHLR